MYTYKLTKWKLVVADIYFWNLVFLPNLNEFLGDTEVKI